MNNAASEMNNAPSEMNNAPSEMNNAASEMNNAASEMNNAASEMNNAPSEMNNAATKMTTTYLVVLGRRASRCQFSGGRRDYRCRRDCRCHRVRRHGSRCHPSCAASSGPDVRKRLLVIQFQGHTGCHTKRMKGCKQDG
jgi:hypothetical protein